MDERPVKLYVFDADGTLRRTTVPGLPCPNGPGDWELIPGVRERLARIDWGAGGARFGVATNQGGVGLGYLTLATARRLLAEMVEEAFGVKPPHGSVEICPHAPHAGCARRDALRRRHGQGRGGRAPRGRPLPLGARVLRPA